MEVTSEVVNRAAVVHPVGEVDINTSVKLRQELKASLKRQPALLVVDLGGVGYMDSSGLATLIEAFKELKKHDGRLVLAAPTPPVRQVLKFAHLESVFQITETLAEALK